MSVHTPVRAPAYSIDWNAAAKDAVTAGLNEIPVAGSFLSTLTGILWPDSSNPMQIWDEIEKEVEQLVAQQLAAAVQTEVTGWLQGLQTVSANYSDSAQPGHSAQFTSEQWSAARATFANTLPQFMLSGYEVLLLPLFAQAANLHLALLRDGALYGQQWGFNGADYQSIVTELQRNIAAYTNWAQRIFGLGTASALTAGGVDYHGCQPFRSANAYQRETTSTVLDFAARWPYFDSTLYPNGASAAQLYLTREVYSDPFGTADDSGLFLLPWTAPTASPTQITVWVAEPDTNLIDAVQVTYPAGTGPDGATQTPRMGSSSGVPTTIAVAAGNPITAVDVWAGNVVQGMQFTFADGTTSPMLGTEAGTHSTVNLNTDGGTRQILSGVYVNGTSSFYGCADAVVFGFRFDPNSPTAVGSAPERHRRNGDDRRHL